ncbi:MAG: ABC transporter ATP-binding protein [Brevinema sp.]
MIKVENVSKIYKHPLGDVTVLKNASFCVEKGETVAVVGESGRGKTTLLYLLAGLDTFEGKIFINNTEIGRLDEKSLSAFRAKHIGFVFQHHFLLEDLTAWENAVMPLRIAGINDAQHKQDLAALFDALGLSQRKGHRPSEMSGGERQRVSLIRALACRPPLLFADEPTGSLDKQNATKLENILFELAAKYGTTLLISTHSVRLAERCQRVLPIDSISH